MTILEFNAKYRDYLEEGHYGLDIDIPEIIQYLDAIFVNLIMIPGFQYSQIKLKFGRCRFYTNLVGPLENTIERRIDEIIKSINNPC